MSLESPPAIVGSRLEYNERRRRDEDGEDECDDDDDDNYGCDGHLQTALTASDDRLSGSGSSSSTIRGPR